MSTEPSPLPSYPGGIALNVAYLYGRVVSTTNPQEGLTILWIGVDQSVRLYDEEGLIGPSLLGADILVEATVEANEDGEPVLILRSFATGGPGKWAWSPSRLPVVVVETSSEGGGLALVPTER